MRLSYLFWRTTVLERNVGDRKTQSPLQLIRIVKPSNTNALVLVLHLLRVVLIYYWFAATEIRRGGVLWLFNALKRC
jgi:hypothetical protein